MDITTCPDCGDDTMNAGLAFWPDVDGPVDVLRCASDACEWATVATEVYPATRGTAAGRSRASGHSLAA